MELLFLLNQEPMEADVMDQDVMIYAMHNKKRLVDYCQKIAPQYSGRPMEEMSSKLTQDEENHLARLEELNESAYMKDN